MPTRPEISVVVVDEIAHATVDLVTSMGLAAEAFECGKTFLKPDDLRVTSCLITHMQMPGMTGPELHNRLLPRVRRGLSPRTLKRVREYIDTHLEDNVSLQSLSRAAGLSMSRFCSAFKQSQGVPPHEYLMRSRVRHAQALLAETDLPLSEIARACGFSDQSHCTRRFRELVGSTPGGYRQSMRKLRAIE